MASPAEVRRDERGKRRLGFYAKLSPNNPKKKNVGHPCIKWVSRVCQMCQNVEIAGYPVKFP